MSLEGVNVSQVRDNSPADGVDDSQRSTRYWLHLVDNLFRRLPLYLVPVVVMLFLGATLAQSASDDYVSAATIDASENPLVGELDVRGAEGGFRQTAAQTTADFIGEQLRTDVFATDVAEAAGLGEALENGLITPMTIRSSVGVTPNGDSIIKVRSTWSDPVTAQLLGQATIETYREYVVDTVASDGLAAVDFYTALQEQAQEQVVAAQRELQDYVVNLPPLAADEVRPIEQELTIQRLNSALDRAEENVQTSTAEIETARLQVAQSRSEAGQSVRVIDPPSLPGVPQPKLFKMLSVVLVFGVLGVLISGTALVVTTALDRTIRFDLDVVPATGSPIVATIPVVSSLLPSKRRFRRRRRDAAAPSSERTRRRGRKKVADEAEAEEIDAAPVVRTTTAAAVDAPEVDEVDEDAEVEEAEVAEVEDDEVVAEDGDVDEVVAVDGDVDEAEVDDDEVDEVVAVDGDVDDAEPATAGSARDRPVDAPVSSGARNGSRRKWRTKIGGTTATVTSGEVRR
jgi:hypothetical protein